MKIGDRVITVDGPGFIVAIEDFKMKRYGVKLDGFTNELYYFEKEIQEAIKNETLD
jgi:hypothetical protein